jgi:hypothetical protein
MRILFYLISAAGLVSAGTLTTASASDSCGTVTNSGTTSASAVITCDNRQPGAFASGSVSDGSFTAQGSLGNNGIFGPGDIDPAMVSLAETITEEVEVIGVGSGNLIFGVTESGSASLDELSNGGVSMTINGEPLGPPVFQPGGPCAFGTGTATCFVQYSPEIPVTYGVPFPLVFSIIATLNGAGNENLDVGYSLTSDQDLIDVPEPNSALMVLLALAAGATGILKVPICLPNWVSNFNGGSTRPRRGFKP